MVSYHFVEIGAEYCMVPPIDDLMERTEQPWTIVIPYSGSSPYATMEPNSGEGWVGTSFGEPNWLDMGLLLQAGIEYPAIIAAAMPGPATGDDYWWSRVFGGNWIASASLEEAVLIYCSFHHSHLVETIPPNWLPIPYLTHESKMVSEIQLTPTDTDVNS